MSDGETFRVELPADDEGYFRVRCPHCGAEPMLRVREFKAEDSVDLTCPVCGMKGPTPEFLLRDDVREVIEKKAINLVRDRVEDMFTELERDTRNNEFVQFKNSNSPDRENVPELREFADLAEADLPCCQRHVKVDPATAASAVYCPYCGQVVV